MSLVTLEKYDRPSYTASISRIGDSFQKSWKAKWASPNTKWNLATIFTPVIELLNNAEVSICEKYPG